MPRKLPKALDPHDVEQVRVAGERFRKLREARFGSRSLSKFAATHGFGKDQLSRFETGDSPEMSLVQIAKFASAMGVSLDWLWYGVEVARPDERARLGMLRDEWEKAQATINRLLELIDGIFGVTREVSHVTGLAELDAAWLASDACLNKDIEVRERAVAIYDANRRYTTKGWALVIDQIAAADFTAGTLNADPADQQKVARTRPKRSHRNVMGGSILERDSEPTPITRAKRPRKAKKTRARG